LDTKTEAGHCSIRRVDRILRTIWFDDVTRTAYIEPVATVPAHQRKGLGKAVLMEGLQRLKHMGCKVAFVGGYSQAANALYFSAMGPDHDISEPWEKIF
jgi:mycothiol synthase